MLDVVLVAGLLALLALSLFFIVGCAALEPPETVGHGQPEDSLRS